MHRDVTPPPPPPKPPCSAPPQPPAVPPELPVCDAVSTDRPDADAPQLKSPVVGGTLPSHTFTASPSTLVHTRGAALRAALSPPAQRYHAAAFMALLNRLAGCVLASGRRCASVAVVDGSLQPQTPAASATTDQSVLAAAFHAAVSAGVPLDVATHATLIRYFATDPDCGMEAVQWVFNRMHAAGLTPTLDTYDAVIGVYVARGVPEDAVPFLQQMAARYAIPVTLYRTLLEAVDHHDRRRVEPAKTRALIEFLEANVASELQDTLHAAMSSRAMDPFVPAPSTLPPGVVAVSVDVHHNESSDEDDDDDNDDDDDDDHHHHHHHGAVADLHRLYRAAGRLVPFDVDATDADHDHDHGVDNHDVEADGVGFDPRAMDGDYSVMLTDSGAMLVPLLDGVPVAQPLGLAHVAGLQDGEDVEPPPASALQTGTHTPLTSRIPVASPLGGAGDDARSPPLPPPFNFLYATDVDVVAGDSGTE